jgi:hypothetical protein
MVSLRTAWSTLNWRAFARPERLIIAGMLLAALGIGGLLALRSLRPAVPAQTLPGQTLAWDIARAAGRSPGVQIASGAYLPGDTLLLYSRVAQADRARVRTWALLQLEPFAERLASMPKAETLKWVIDFGAAPAEQEVITAPLSRAADATLYRYTSAAPDLFADVAAGATAAPVQPAQPAPAQPTAAPAQPAQPAPAQPTAAPAQPAQPAPAQPTAAPAQPAQGTSVRDLNFDNAESASKNVKPISGDWAASDGVYTQRDTKGYDYISMLNTDPLSHYSLEARLRLVEGDMGGGFIYNAPNQNVRAGAQIVDMDKQGTFLRWGRYDDKGAYVYGGGAKLDPPVNDGQWHTLHLLTDGSTSVVAVDGHQLGKIANKSASGYVGLTTSLAHVDFDNISLIALQQNGDTPAQPTAAPAQPTGVPAQPTGVPAQPTGAPAQPTSSQAITSTAASDPISNTTGLSDDFANGNANKWRVLNGTWQFINQEYQQTSASGFDLGSISTFQGDAYTVMVRVRRLDGDMGAGLYLNMAQRDSKAHSQMINYTQGGKAVQWGHFDEGGNFVYEGSAQVPDGNDGQWHVFGVTVRGGKASFSLDGKPLAKDVPLTYKSGYVGLLASSSKVAFDDVKIAALKQ